MKKVARKSKEKIDESTSKSTALSKYMPVIVKILFVAGLLFVTYLAFFQLGKSPMENWDEAWYADVTRNMMQTKQFFVMYWNEALWLDKPPLYMWLSAMVASIIGLSEFSVRVPSAISGIIIVMLVAWFSYKNYGLVPAFLAFVTLALNNVFVWRMRSGNIDILSALLILLVFLVQLSKTKYKYVLLGLLFALIYLARAQLVFLPIGIFVLHELLFERTGMIKRYKQYLLMIAIAVLLPAIWLYGGSLVSGASFANYFIYESDHGVATVSLSQFNLDYFLYTYYSLQRRFTFVLIIGVLFALWYIKDPKAFLMLLYGGALLAQLSFTERTNNWYLIPAMPFWSLLIAYGTYHIIKIFRNNLMLKIAILLVTSLLAYRTLTINILPILDTSANEKQTESSKVLNTLTKEGETIVRLDHLYPTTVYYTERKILSSPDNVDGTTELFISRKDVSVRVRDKSIKWLVGKNSDTDAVKKAAPDVQFKERKVNDEETILEVQ